MTFEKEFNYSSLFQRRVMFFNLFLTFFSAGFVFTDISIYMKYYLFYFPVLKAVLAFSLSGMFLGSIFSRLLFSSIKNSRIMYIISDILFICVLLVYIFRDYIYSGQNSVFFELFSISPLLIPVFVVIVGFTVGFKTIYYLKISCGDFLDEKKGISKFMAFSLLGLIAGVAFTGLRFYTDNYALYASVSVLFMLPSLYFIKLPFDPQPLYTRQFKEETEGVQKTNFYRDDLFFNYCNFSYIVIYLYLGLETVIKFYGDLFYVKILFFLITLTAVVIGIAAGRIVRLAFWHIYTEMIFPVFFLGFVFLTYMLSGSIPFYYGELLFVPVAVLFGFLLYHTYSNISSNYDQRKRFSIISLSTFFIPAIILLAMLFVEFTNLWYFIFIYSILIINIIVPGIHLVNRQIKVYKKVLFFVFSLIFLPVLIFIHMFYKIPLNNTLFVQRTAGFEELKDTNYNSSYIKNRGSVQMNGAVVFSISDSIIRNLKRSLVPVFLFNPGEGRILYIDGNQKFFRNPVISMAKDSVCLDLMSEREVDYNVLPMSGRQNYIPEEELLFSYLNKYKDDFNVIVDIPNLLDQNKNYFRFTVEYYNQIKSSLHQNGVFVQLYDINKCKPSFLSASVKNLKKSFKENIVFLFSDILVVMSSDGSGVFKINRKNINHLKKKFRDNQEISKIFWNETHLLSHLLLLDVENIYPYLKKSAVDPFYWIRHESKAPFEQEFFENYKEKNDVFVSLVSRKDRPLNKFIKSNTARNRRILKLLKSMELAESEGNYEKETEFLFELKRFTEYRTVLRKYINEMLSYKEEYYFDAAMRLEKEKKWEEARKLYSSILTIDRKNFDANYRMGLLCITLQDIDGAFHYLQQAMKLKRNHPKVLYQMGILLFSSGRTQDAISYLTRALEQRERSSSVYFYLGLSHEKLGNNNEAEYFYTKAHLEDPNDSDIKSRLENIKLLKEEEKKRWKSPVRKNQLEEEQGENIPLPINKSAYDIRLKDKETGKKK